MPFIASALEQLLAGGPPKRMSSERPQAPEPDDPPDHPEPDDPVEPPKPAQKARRWKDGLN